MDSIMSIVWAVVWFAILGGVFGLLLAIAAKVFYVKTDPRVEEIAELLPGANCGGCGYAGCAALADAIAKGEAKCTACVAGSEEVANSIAKIMGVEAEQHVRMRAQVMCSGAPWLVDKKYIYAGAKDCYAASKMSGGDKRCPNGCIGLGTCVASCVFDAIRIENGVAVVDYDKCQACGRCVEACPKHIIKLIPFHSTHWVGCMSVDKGAITRSYCKVGCISCKKCEKVCQHGAIKVTDFVASIDYEKCVHCGECVEACPRKIIWSDKSQSIAVTIDPGHIQNV